MGSIKSRRLRQTLYLGMRNLVVMDKTPSTYRIAQRCMATGRGYCFVWKTPLKLGHGINRINGVHTPAGSNATVDYVILDTLHLWDVLPRDVLRLQNFPSLQDVLLRQNVLPSTRYSTPAGVTSPKIQLVLRCWSDKSIKYLNILDKPLYKKLTAIPHFVIQRYLW